MPVPSRGRSLDQGRHRRFRATDDCGDRSFSHYAPAILGVRLVLAIIAQSACCNDALDILHCNRPWKANCNGWCAQPYRLPISDPNAVRCCHARHKHLARRHNVLPAAHSHSMMRWLREFLRIWAVPPAQFICQQRWRHPLPICEIPKGARVAANLLFPDYAGPSREPFARRGNARGPSL